MEIKKNNMSKEDKKFFISLFFAQTGVLAGLIMFSPYYWSGQAQKLKELRAMAELSNSFEFKVNELDSESKIQKLKFGYEKKGIGVEKVNNLKTK